MANILTRRIKSVVKELKLVEWITFQQTMHYTYITMVFLVISTAAIAFLDSTFAFTRNSFFLCLNETTDPTIECMLEKIDYFDFLGNQEEESEPTPTVENIEVNEDEDITNIEDETPSEKENIENTNDPNNSLEDNS